METSDTNNAGPDLGSGSDIDIDLDGVNLDDITNDHSYLREAENDQNDMTKNHIFLHFRLRKVKMDQRQLMDNSSTITDMARVRKLAAFIFQSLFLLYFNLGTITVSQ